MGISEQMDKLLKRRGGAIEDQGKIPKRTSDETSEEARKNCESRANFSCLPVGLYSRVFHPIAITFLPEPRHPVVRKIWGMARLTAALANSEMCKHESGAGKGHHTRCYDNASSSPAGDPRRLGAARASSELLLLAEACAGGPGRWSRPR